MTIAVNLSRRTFLKCRKCTFGPNSRIISGRSLSGRAPSEPEQKVMPLAGLSTALRMCR